MSEFQYSETGTVLTADARQRQVFVAHIRKNQESHTRSKQSAHLVRVHKYKIYFCKVRFYLLAI